MIVLRTSAAVDNHQNQTATASDVSECKSGLVLPRCRYSRCSTRPELRQSALASFQCRRTSLYSRGPAEFFGNGGAAEPSNRPKALSDFQGIASSLRLFIRRRIKSAACSFLSFEDGLKGKIATTVPLASLRAMAVLCTTLYQGTGQQFDRDSGPFSPPAAPRASSIPIAMSIITKRPSMFDTAPLRLKNNWLGGCEAAHISWHRSTLMCNAQARKLPYCQHRVTVR